jgi:hypothetical protein
VAKELRHIPCIKINTTSRYSAVGIVTGYGMDDGGVGVQSPGGVKNFLFFQSSRPALGPMQSVPGTLFPGVKRPRREADHSPPANAEIKKCSIHPLPHTPS